MCVCGYHYHVCLGSITMCVWVPLPCVFGYHYHVCLGTIIMFIWVSLPCVFGYLTLCVCLDARAMQ